MQMFKDLLKTINEETDEDAKRVLAISLVTSGLFFSQRIGPARAAEAMSFVETHCAELFLVQTDIGFILVDFDKTFQIVFPAHCKDAYSALCYIEETANDLNESESEEA